MNKDSKSIIFPKSSHKSFKVIHEEPYKLYKNALSTISTMRPATPDSLMRIRDISSRGLSDRRLTPFKTENNIKDPVSICTSNYASDNRIETKKESISRTNKSQKTIVQPKRTIELNYRDFKRYHKEPNQQRKNFIKRFNCKVKIEKIKKIILHAKTAEIEEPEDNFLKNTIYAKPALTYEEKMYRLQQVSIFK